MPLPGGLTSITVTGTYADGAGRPLGGTVTFWPSAEITDATGHVIIGMTPVTAVVSQSTGQFSQALVATDNAGLLPQGWTYKIQVAVAGAQQVFNAYIPSSYGSTVDISVLGPVQPLPTLTGPYVVTVNGQSGQVTVGGTGTVTDVSVASANGFAGTVATPASTPAITVETTVTGLLKGNGTGVSAAVSGTDYAPATTGTSLLKGSGSGGFSAAAAADVPGFDGVTVTGTPSSGMVPTATSGTAATWQAPAGVPILTFTYGSSGAVPSSGTYTAGDLAVDQNNIARVCTVSGTPGTWRRAAAQPYQFFADDYGAKGDGKLFNGGTGTASSAAFSDTTNSPFASGDTGKVIIVNQGAEGSFTNPFCGTIAGFTDSGHVTLNAALGSNASTAPYIYGTDDATAIQNCVNAAAAWAMATGGPYQVQVIFGDKNYMLAALHQVQGTGTTTGYNTHVPVPVGPQAGQKLIIDLVGTGTGMDAGNAQWPFTTIPNLHGTNLVSAVFNSTQPNATYGRQSVIGGPTYVGVGPLANTALVVSGITCVAPWSSATDGVNGNLLTQMNVPDGGYMGFAPINGSNVTPLGGPSYQANGYVSANSIAFDFPAFLNNDSNNVGLISVQGAGTGVQLTEHFTAQKLNLIYCGTAMQVSAVTTAYHGATILQVSSEGSNIVLACAGSSGGRFPVWIGLMDSEFINSEQINDPGNFLGGVVYWATADANAHFPDVVGAQNLAVIDLTHNGPGPWSGAPAAPSSGSATTNTQQNTSYRNATVYASATTSITNAWTGPPSLNTGLTPTGLAGGANVVVPVRVAPGGYWSVAYTGTLTATWILD